MQFSPDTLELFKNFSEINQSIYLQEGNILSTITTQETLAAFVEIEETIPENFGIYGLKEFLNIYGLYTSPKLEFTDKYLLITEANGKNKVRIVTASPEVITYPELEKRDRFNKIIKSDKNTISFTLSSDDLGKIIKASGIISAPYLSLESDGEEVNFVLSNPKDDAKTQYSLEVGEGNGSTYKLYLKTENLRLMKGAYEVAFSPQGLSVFRNTSLNLEYFIALEDISTFKKG